MKTQPPPSRSSESRREGTCKASSRVPISPLASSRPARSPCFQICFLRAYNQCLSEVHQLALRGILPPPASINLLLSEGSMAGLLSPLSMFSTFWIITLFQSKRSNLFHLRCLAVLESQEPLWERKGWRTE